MQARERDLTSRLSSREDHLKNLQHELDQAKQATALCQRRATNSSILAKSKDAVLEEERQIHEQHMADANKQVLAILVDSAVFTMLLCMPPVLKISRTSLTCTLDRVQIRELKAHVAALAPRSLNDVTNQRKPTTSDRRAAAAAANALAAEYGRLEQQRRHLEEHGELRGAVEDLEEELSYLERENRQNAAQRAKSSNAAQRAKQEAGNVAAASAAQATADTDRLREEIYHLERQLQFMRSWPHVEMQGDVAVLVVPQRDATEPEYASLNFTTKRLGKDGKPCGGREFHWSLRVLVAELSAVARIAPKLAPLVIDLVLRYTIFAGLDPCASSFCLELQLVKVVYVGHCQP